jgi:putative transposase
MDEETVDRIRAATNGNYVLGGGRFEAEIAATLKRRVARGTAGRPSKAGAELGQPRRMDG